MEKKWRKSPLPGVTRYALTPGYNLSPIQGDFTAYIDFSRISTFVKQSLFLSKGPAKRRIAIVLAKKRGCLSSTLPVPYQEIRADKRWLWYILSVPIVCGDTARVGRSKTINENDDVTSLSWQPEQDRETTVHRIKSQCKRAYWPHRGQ